jgi:NAD(P)-dependent dehydrogenase (short-subunit alcohol dehydrogenase family)
VRHQSCSLLLTPPPHLAAHRPATAARIARRCGIENGIENGLENGIENGRCGAGQIALSCVGGAVENLVKGLAAEIAPRRINAVSPGLINTPMFDAMGAAKDATLAGG